MGVGAAAIIGPMTDPEYERADAVIRAIEEVDPIDTAAAVAELIANVVPPVGGAIAMVVAQWRQDREAVRFVEALRGKPTSLARGRTQEQSADVQFTRHPAPRCRRAGCG